MGSTHHRIAAIVELDTQAGREILRGMAAAAGERRFLLRRFDPGVDGRIALAWRPHVAIAAGGDDLLAEALSSAGCPVITLRRGTPLDAAAAVAVLDDDAAIGRLAAEHLLDRGFTRLAFASDGSMAARDRWEGFARKLGERGTVAATIQMESAQEYEAWKTQSQRLADWLRGLDRPCGVFASDDAIALRIGDACADLALDVPVDIAILGAGDDAVCQIARPALSSIRTGAFAIGQAAIGSAAALIAGASGIPDQHVPPGEVRTRASTDTLAFDDPAVLAVLRVIRARANGRLDIAGLLPVCGLGRRTLEKRFAAAVGRSIAAEIARVRIETARQLLLETPLSLAQVAIASGFGSEVQLRRAFLRQVGRPPGQWRAEMRASE